MVWVECEHCFVEFEAERRTRKFCSDSCRQRAWRKQFVYSDADADLLKLLETAAAKFKEGRSPLKELRKLARITDGISDRDFAARFHSRRR